MEVLGDPTKSCAGIWGERLTVLAEFYLHIP